METLEKLQKYLEEMQKSPIKTLNVVYDWKTYTAVYDTDYKIICVLIDWKYNKYFNQDFFNNFCDLELYSNWKLNIRQADFITNYKSYEK